MSASVTLTTARPSNASLEGTRARTSRRYVLAFLVGGIGFQIGLFQFGDTALRMPLRGGLYLLSLVALIMLRGTGRPHPANRIIHLIIVVLGISLLMPGGGVMASVAQLTLYLAVLAPMIWIGRLTITRQTFRYTLIAIWAFHTASAAVGVLQVRYPGLIDGAISNNYDDAAKGAMSIVTAEGAHILRPKGLTDVAGGAGGSGVSAAILGIGLLLTARGYPMRIAAAASLFASLFSIYLSHGRTNLILVAVGRARVSDRPHPAQRSETIDPARERCRSGGIDRNVDRPRGRRAGDGQPLDEPDG